MKLEGLRFFGPGIVRLYLALFVVVQHLDLFGLGTTAVYLFFVLSGFWITRLWNAKYVFARFPYLTFLVGRYWRLFPLYFVCMTLMGTAWAYCCPRVVQGILPLSSDPGWLAGTVLIAGSSLQPHFLHTTWSLDIEMQFYLLAPLLIGVLKLLADKGQQTLLLFTGPVIAISLALLILHPSLNRSLACYLGFFVAGCLIHYLGWRPSLRVALSGIGCFVAVTGLLWLHPEGRPIVDTRLPLRFAEILRMHQIYSLIAVGCLLPVVAFSLGQHSDPWDRSLGKLAYPVYLFHVIPIELIDRMPRVQELGKAASTGLTLGVLLAGSLLLFFLVDRPMEGLRQRFLHARCRKPLPLGKDLAH